MESNSIIAEKYTIKLVREEIEVNEGIESVKSVHCGAISLFLGTTRITESCDEEESELSHLYYEAYVQMALKEMVKIVEKQMGNCDAVHKCYLCHRLGCVPVGHTSIMIACSAPHRTEAHHLVMSILNDVKAKVPIWKKINYVNSNNSEWSDKSEAFWLNK